MNDPIRGDSFWEARLVSLVGTLLTTVPISHHLIEL